MKRFQSVILNGLVICVITGSSFASTISVAKSGGDYPTIQAGVTAANADDTVLVKAGTYNEAVTFGKSGSASNGYITLKGETGAILDGVGKGEQGVTIADKNYIKVIGMEVRNFAGGGTPIGISIEGSSGTIEIRNNIVHTIENPNGNAHGIAVYGTASTPISDIVIDANEIRNCKLGQSESMVLNGNVTRFIVSNNVIHDNDNIGIDFIGFEGTGPTGQDQARSGICFGNHVYNISSAANPTYNGERSADGIYVDGGKDIVIERNNVDNCDIGIEIASEHNGKTTSGITVRSNFVSRSFQGNIMAGGYAANMGNASDIAIVNNTLFHGNDGEVVLQFNCSNIAINNNICVANSGTDYLSASGSNNSGISVDNNLYYGASANSPGSWSDTHAKYANPLLVNAPTDMHLQPTSPAKNNGAALDTAHAGTLDIDGQPRVQESLIDIGADETNATAVFAARQTSFPAAGKPPVIVPTHGRPIMSTIGASPITLLFSLDGRCAHHLTGNGAGTVIFNRAFMGKGTYVLRTGTGPRIQTILLPIIK
jgi:hypothetical protein